MYTPSAWQSSLPTLFKITVLGSALAALGITGCASTQSAASAKANQTGGAYLDASGVDGLEDLLSATDMRAVEGDRLLVLKHGDVWKRMTVGFKMNLAYQHPRIEAQRGWFISRQPYLDRLSARASRYLYHTVKEAERRGMPTELALLPVIESSYDPAATSSAAAAGLWQFIPSTGRIYGLKQNSGYDGRRDVVESTRAAYEFLGSLYNQFGSWELALAAYNAGPGRIQQAINRNKAAGLPTDYWSLKLPQETMNYVPRFLAVAQIIQQPGTYGVRLPPIANRPHFREISVGTASLNDIAQITGLSRAELYQLNPGHRSESIDSQSPMRILIPADLSPTLDARLKNLSSGSSTLLASQNTINTSPKGGVSILPSKATPPVLNAPVLAKAPAVVSTPAASVSTTVKPASSVAPVLTAKATKRVSTPRGAAALAEFASKSAVPIPSAPRIPVAVTPVASVKPIVVEPPITIKEREELQAVIQAEDKTVTVEDILQPVATADEQAKVVAELQSITPAGTEIIDPYDGKIKLTAIQTSQSIAEQTGKELSKGFAYPKGLADNTQPNSIEAKLNQNKNVVRTEAEVVVIPPKGIRSTYKVLPGDNLVTIAAKHGLNWRDVARWNQIDPNATLYVGTSIYLYDAKPVVEVPKPVVKSESYVVQANDTLIGVANQFALPLKDLAEWNGLNSNSGIFVGQKLVLKETLPARASAVNAQTVESKVQTSSYSVKRGEYLKLIADRYGLSNAELAALTPGLTANSQLFIGQKMNVPSEVDSVKAVAKVEDKPTEIKTESYTVKRGDTLSSIANLSKISIPELAALNQLSARAGLRLGQTLVVPAGTTVPELYVVQAGDTLTAIAQKYDLTIEQIADANTISRQSSLRVGQRLKLMPDTAGDSQATSVSEIKTNASSTATESYTVKSGESLNAIARRYNMTTVDLAGINNLRANAGLSIGQTLQVPKLVTEYKVRRGDTLIGLANRYRIDVAELLKMNDFAANTLLKVGDVIKVPN